MKKMTVIERIKLCRLIGKMEKQKEYCEKLGIKNVSKFGKNKNVDKKEKEKRL